MGNFFTIVNVLIKLTNKLRRGNNWNRIEIQLYKWYYEITLSSSELLKIDYYLNFSQYVKVVDGNIFIYIIFENFKFLYLMFILTQYKINSNNNIIVKIYCQP